MSTSSVVWLRGWNFFLVVYLAAQDEVGALQITALDIPQQRDWGELEHNAWQTDLIHNNNLYLH